MACAESRFSFRLLTYNNKVEGRFTIMDRFRISKIFSSDTEPRNKSENQFWCKTLNNENALYKSDGTTYTPIKTNSNNVVVNVGSNPFSLTQYLNENFATIGEALESLEGASANKQDKSPTDDKAYSLLNGGLTLTDQVVLTKYVYTSGSNTVQDGSLALPYHSIGAAVTAHGVSPEVIWVNQGMYTENVTLSNKRNLQLKGTSGIRSTASNSASVISGTLTISGAAMQNVSVSSMYVNQATTVSATGVTFENMVFNGIVTVSSASYTVIFENCLFNDEVIVSGGSAGVEFNRCNFSGGDTVNLSADLDAEVTVRHCIGLNAHISDGATFTAQDSYFSGFIANNNALQVTLYGGGCLDVITGEPIAITVQTVDGYALNTFAYKAEGSTFSGSRQYNGLQADQVQDTQTFQIIQPESTTASAIFTAIDKAFGEVVNSGEIITDAWVSDDNAMAPIITDTQYANKKGRITISPKITNVGAVYVGQSLTDKTKAFPLYPDQIVAFAFSDITNFDIGVDAVGDGCNYVIEFGPATVSDLSIEGGIEIRGEGGSLYKLIPSGDSGSETFKLQKVS